MVSRFSLETSYLYLHYKENLISVSRLDKEQYECYFGHGKCVIWCNNIHVGVAFLHNELYLLSLHEKVCSVSKLNEIVPASIKKQKKRKRTHDSSKLWHCRLGHISRRRIERLVKNKILPPLEFSDIEQCIVCIKNNMNVILDMGSVPYGVIIFMWGLLFFTMSFIYCFCVKKFILCVM